MSRLHLWIASTVILLSSPDAAGGERRVRGDSSPIDDDLADDEPVYETEVRGYRIHPTGETTGFAETIDVAEDPPRLRTVNDALSESVGVQTRGTGGTGTYSQIGIRGSSAKQVPVLLDGIPVQTGGTGGVNLGDFSLDLLDTIEVYRGSIPIALGVGGIGGVVRLTTRIPEYAVSRGSLSIGSFGEKQLSLIEAVPVGAVDTLLILSVEDYDGDFAYLNRYGTPLDPSDDRTERRENNDHTAYSVLSKTKWGFNRWRVTGAEDLFAKEEGIPGTESLNFKHARMQKLRSNTTLEARRPLPETGELALRLNYLGIKEIFRDPGSDDVTGVEGQRAGGVQMVSRLQSRTHAAQVQVTFQNKWNSRHQTTCDITDRFDAFGTTERDPEGDVGKLQTFRNTVAVGLGHDWRPVDAVTVSPAIRATFSNAYRNAGSDPTGEASLPQASTSVYDASPALGIRYDLNKNLTIKTNVGRYIRLPELTELYGYSGAVNGNPNLKQETGLNGDLGFTLTAENKGFMTLARLTGAVFTTWSQDLVVYEQQSQGTVWPVNASSALVLGAETDATALLWQHVTLSGNYTYLNARDISDDPTYHGKKLPGRPAHKAWGKIEGTLDIQGTAHGLWIDGDYLSQCHLKRYNQPEYLVPGRFFLGAGYRFELTEKRITITVMLSNILDVTTYKNDTGETIPLQDFWGFPLPGRSFFTTLYWKI